MRKRGWEWAGKVDGWLFSILMGEHKLWGWVFVSIWYLMRFVSWFGDGHPFNPWACDSCRFEAECGYESKNEREIADHWRKENGVEL
jgi:hypothetical protein